MKKAFVLTLIGVIMAGVAMGVPANPRWLQELAAQGETEKVEQLRQRGERTIGELKREELGLRPLQRVADRKKVGMPLNIAPKGLIIMVNFNNLSWTVANHAEIDSMINGQNYSRSYSYSYYGNRYNVISQGSARQFFHDVSDGQYNPEFTVVGPVTVSKSFSYYGQNDSGGDDSHPEEMVAEACRLADQQGVDFTQFDNDGDGDIDFVYILYAGYQESDGAGDNYIWPHSYSLESYYYVSQREGGLGNAAVMLDGKRLNAYACSGEVEYYSNQHQGIGTFCHEFGHVLGLPDLYATNDATHKTLGDWDIMDSGSYNNDGNTPSFYSAYERMFMGWATPTVINTAGTYQLSNPHDAYLICAGGQHNLIGNDPNPTTFYLLENRQLTGWDEHLPGHGLMITKVNYNYAKWEQNIVNNTSSSMGVDILEADGRAPNYSQYSDNGYSGKAGDLYPAGSTSCSKISGYPISNISESNGVITFTVGGGTSGGGDTTTTVVGGDCGDYSWTATSSLSAGDIMLGDYSWTITVPTGAYFGYEGSQNARGAQFGSKNNPVQQVSLLTGEVAGCLVSAVTIDAAQGRDGDSKLSVYINCTRVGEEQTLNASSTDHTFTNSAGLRGALEIRITNTKKAAYIKSISIAQTATSTDAVKAIEQNNAQKIWRDGQLIIIRDGKQYDVLGRVL